MLKLNDKSKKKYHTNIKRGTFEMPLFMFDGLNLNHAIDESQLSCINASLWRALSILLENSLTRLSELLDLEKNPILFSQA